MEFQAAMYGLLGTKSSRTVREGPSEEFKFLFQGRSIGALSPFISFTQRIREKQTKLFCFYVLSYCCYKERLRSSHLTAF